MMSKQFNFTRKSKGAFRSQRTVQFKEKLGVTVRSNGSSRSTVKMKRRLIETMRLSRDHPINDGGLRCVHVCVKRRVVSSRALGGLDLIRGPLVAMNLNRYNS